MDCTQIFQEGYSTKGEGRGMGLSILEHIVHQNENIRMETRMDPGEFVQEMTIC